MRVEATGTIFEPLTGELPVNTIVSGTQQAAVIATLPDGGWVVTWASPDSDGLGVFMRRYGADGVPAGDEVRVNTTTANEQQRPAVTALADGGYVALWQTRGSNNNVTMQRFGADGVPVGGEQVVAGIAADRNAAPAIAVLDDGSYVVVWSYDGVTAQRYAANGTPIGGASVLAGFGAEITVMAMPGGGYAVSWNTLDPDNGSGMQARLFNADGSPAGPVFTVNETLAGSQTGTAGSLAVLADGRIAFVWNGAGTGDSTGIFLRVFGISGGADPNDGTPGDDVRAGGSGPDMFDLSQGGNDIVSGGAGDDGFWFGAAFTADDRVDGGSGDNDQIGLLGDYGGANALMLAPGTITGVEVIALLGGVGARYDITTVDANVAAGGLLTIYGTNLAAGNDLTFDGSAETDGSFRVYGGAGADILTGGAPNDGFWFGPSRFNPATDRVDGGGGTNDQLALDGNYTLTLDGVSIHNIEAITLQRGPAGDLNSFDVTLADSLVTAGGQITIWGAPLLTSLRVDGSAEMDGNLRIYGGHAGDTLIDGAGKDTFVYDGIGQSTGAAYDRIDFQSGDRIDLYTGVTGIGQAMTGALDAASLGSSLSALLGGALSANRAMIFNVTGGDLDGSVFLIVDTNGEDGYQEGGGHGHPADRAAPGAEPRLVHLTGGLAIRNAARARLLPIRVRAGVSSAGSNPAAIRRITSVSRAKPGSIPAACSSIAISSGASACNRASQSADWKPRRGSSSTASGTRPRSIARTSQRGSPPRSSRLSGTVSISSITRRSAVGSSISTPSRAIRFRNSPGSIVRIRRSRAGADGAAIPRIRRNISPPIARRRGAWRNSRHSAHTPSRRSSGHQ